MMVVKNIKYKLSIIGFHGTLFESAQKILNGNYKIGEPRDDHWLGQGVYFFREDYEQAKSWVMSKMKKEKKDGAVLMTTISIDSDAVLDLDSRKGLMDFVNFKKEFYKFCLQNNLEIHTDEDILRCAICDELPKDIKVIQRTFEGNAWFNELLEEVNLSMHGKQICVRDVEILDTKKTILQGTVFYNEIQKHRKKKPKIEFS